MPQVKKILIRQVERLVGVRVSPAERNATWSANNAVNVVQWRAAEIGNPVSCIGVDVEASALASRY